MKRTNPNIHSITYDISQLFHFIDQSADLSCLVYQKSTNTYSPYNEDKTGDTDYEARLLASKARVTPSSDKTGKPQVSTPRTEMRGLLFLARLITGVLPGMVAKPGSIFLASDSQCTISTMECEDKVLGMWFGNGVAEIQDHMADWARQDITVELLHYRPGVDNIADLATKGEAAMKDIEAGSAW